MNIDQEKISRLRKLLETTSRPFWYPKLSLDRRRDLEDYGPSFNILGLYELAEAMPALLDFYEDSLTSPVPLLEAVRGLVGSLPDCTLEWAAPNVTNAAVIKHWRDKVKELLE